MEIKKLSEELSATSYPGRGIVVGKSADGKQAVMAYFIMGRSSNSRNRVFVEDGEGIRTQAFDPSKLEDPSLIIYAPVRIMDTRTIVTNGDQTDTIYENMTEKGMSFEESLRCREFEPDGPNYTPRISAIVHVENKLSYKMSILKSDMGDPESCDRFTYSYSNPKAGLGRFIHTYMNDGNPLPSFEGEPTPVTIEGNIDEFTDTVWNSLNEENKVSLFVRFIDIATGKYETRIINKNK